MKVMLVFPPQFDATIPNLALPYLTSMLHASGHEVVQKDVNIEAYDTLLSREELERAYQFICSRRKYYIFSNMSSGEQERLIEKRHFLMESVDEAKKVLRDPVQFYHYHKYKESIDIIKDSLSFLSMAYYNMNLSLESFSTVYSCYSTNQLLKAVQDEESNIFIDFYRRHTLPDIVSSSPRVVGISIQVDCQIIPGLTLARMIKESMKDVHVVIGGKFFTWLKEGIIDNEPLFSLFDSVIIHEGETALPELVNSLEKGISLEKVPNLLYKAGANIIENDIIHIEDINNLPNPYFRGLPLEKYFSPQLILPIYSAKGCYWGKCPFCRTHKTSSDKLRIRPVKKVVEEMGAMAEQYDCRNFSFIDLAIAPAYLEQLSDEILQAGIKVSWSCLTRFDEKFDAKLCRKLASAGCIGLAFGLESASQRMLDMMDKGINTGLMGDVLAASSKAGIFNNVFILFGFPTETVDDAKETIKFVFDNIKNIHSVVVSYFLLLKHSIAYSSPEKYSIFEISSPEDHDLAQHFEYRVEKGFNQNKALKLSRSFLKAIEGLNPYYYNLNLAAYIDHYKTNDFLWVTASGQEEYPAKEAVKEQRLLEARQKADVLLGEIVSWRK